jgi:hypothetical protein
MSAAPDNATPLSDLSRVLARLGEREADMHIDSPEREAWATITFTQGDEVLVIVAIEDGYWAQRLLSR